MKNVCYFMLKVFFVLEIFTFCPGFLVMQKNGVIRKLRLICISIQSQPGQQLIEIKILLDISKSKGNQTIKFVQLIEYNMRNAFLGKSCTKCDEETSLRPFHLKSSLNITLDQHSEML